MHLIDVIFNFRHNLSICLALLCPLSTWLVNNTERCNLSKMARPLQPAVTYRNRPTLWPSVNHVVPPRICSAWRPSWPINWSWRTTMIMTMMDMSWLARLPRSPCWGSCTTLPRRLPWDWICQIFSQVWLINMHKAVEFLFLIKEKFTWSFFNYLWKLLSSSSKYLQLNAKKVVKICCYKYSPLVVHYLCTLVMYCYELPQDKRSTLLNLILKLPHRISPKGSIMTIID